MIDKKVTELLYSAVCDAQITYHTSNHAPTVLNDVLLSILSNKTPTELEWANRLIEYIQSTWPCSVKSINFSYILKPSYYFNLSTPRVDIPYWCKPGTIVEMRYSLNNAKYEIISVDDSGLVKIHHINAPYGELLCVHANELYFEECKEV